MEFVRRQKSKEQRRLDMIFNLYKLFHILCMTFCIVVVWYTRYADDIVSPFFNRGNYIICAGFAIVYLITVRVYGGFQMGMLKPSELVYSQFFALIFSDGMFYGLVCFLARRLVSAMPMLQIFIVQLIVSVIWSRVAAKIYNYFTPTKKTVVLYGNSSARNSISGIFHLEHKFHIMGEILVDSQHVFNAKDIEEADAVFLCGVRSSYRNAVLKYCVGNNIEVYVRPSIGDLLISNSQRIHMVNTPFLHCTRNHQNQIYLMSKRLIDIVISLVALVVLSPFMLLTAVVIKAYDGGPVLYRQCRLTRDGREFNILKFRSMKVDAESDGVARLASENDNRVTPIGKFIRMIRFDELPQLFNILSGKMSLVGPRPERPEIAAQYEKQIPEFSLRLQVKAGLTGYAQIYGRYNTEPYNKLQMDLIYIANQSIIEDLRLLLMTVKVLFMPESTEGVQDGQETAKIAIK